MKGGSWPTNNTESTDRAPEARRKISSEGSAKRERLTSVLRRIEEDEAEKRDKRETKESGTLGWCR